MISATEKKVWAVIYAIALAIIMGLTALPAEAHYLDRVAGVTPNASGGFMDMSDATRYDYAFTEAVADVGALNCAWKTASGDCDGVAVASTTSATASNVDWVDFNDCTSEANASYTPIAEGAGRVNMNVCRMNENTLAEQAGTGRHETLHGMRTNHVPSTYTPSFSLMYPTDAGADNITTHDYEDIWENAVRDDRWDTTPND